MFTNLKNSFTSKLDYKFVVKQMLGCHQSQCIFFRLLLVTWHGDICSRRGGIFKYDFVANLLLSLIVKNFENRSTFGEVMGNSSVSCFLPTRSVYV